MRALYRGSSLEVICRLFGKSRQGWYHLEENKSNRGLKRELVIQMVQQIRDDLPKTGTLKLQFMLKESFKGHRISMGRDSFFTLLRENNLLIKNKKRFTTTTNSQHHFKVWPDLVNRRASTMAEEIWVSDITYLRTISGFIYLSLVTDAYSRKIVGYHLSHNLKASGPVKAFNMAFKNRLYPQRTLIHHSDRGIQYCCQEYVQLLLNKQVRISMTQSGSPYDNAIAERVNGILKGEFGLAEIFNNYSQAMGKLVEVIDKYNKIRPHFSCNLQTPQHTHQAIKIEQKPELEPIQQNWMTDVKYIQEINNIVNLNQ